MKLTKNYIESNITQFDIKELDFINENKGDYLIIDKRTNEPILFESIKITGSRWNILEKVVLNDKIKIYATESNGIIRINSDIYFFYRTELYYKDYQAMITNLHKIANHYKHNYENTIKNLESANKTIKPYKLKHPEKFI